MIRNAISIYIFFILNETEWDLNLMGNQDFKDGRKFQNFK